MGGWLDPPEPEKQALRTHPSGMLSCYRPQHLWEGNVFTSVCHSFCPQGRGLLPGGWADPPPNQILRDTVNERAGGTHPTGMLSCFRKDLVESPTSLK